MVAVSTIALILLLDLNVHVRQDIRSTETAAVKVSNFLHIIWKGLKRKYIPSICKSLVHWTHYAKEQGGSILVLYGIFLMKGYPMFYLDPESYC